MFLQNMPKWLPGPTVKIYITEYQIVRYRFLFPTLYQVYYIYTFTSFTLYVIREEKDFFSTNQLLKCFFSLQKSETNITFATWKRGGAYPATDAWQGRLLQDLVGTGQMQKWAANWEDSGANWNSGCNAIMMWARRRLGLSVASPFGTSCNV